jgi:nanoRNase/pAp phosphatase (c-di-AMP/oligoRNAs hydrolase)
MTVRLVLGCGAGSGSLLERLRTLPGELYVVAADKGRADALRDDTVDAVLGDPADPEAYPESADLVYVAGDDPERNLAAARAARERFPSAYLFARTGLDGASRGEAADRRAAIESVADRVLDGNRAVVEALLSATTGETAGRMARLFRVLRGLEGRLAVVTHDNPDPDAIASALALVRIAEFAGVEAHACYYGDISHQENRALVNLLDVRLRHFTAPEDVDEYAGVALVDHSRPGVNDGLDPDQSVDIVVDHHPPRAPISASFVDLRSDVGATSTLFTRYLRQLDVEPNRTLATALLYGIRVDTRDFSREVSVADYEAAAFLLAYADTSTLERVESPSINPEVLETLARAIRNRHRRGEVLVSSVGRLRDRDALAQAADRLLDMEGVNVTVVYGLREDTIYVSGRARGTDVDIGETLREAYGRIGDAGGHADMAGAQIPVGFLGQLGPGEASDRADGDSTAEDADETDTRVGSGEVAAAAAAADADAEVDVDVDVDVDAGAEDADDVVADLVEESVRALFFETLERGPRRVDRRVDPTEYAADGADG